MTRVLEGAEVARSTTRLPATQPGKGLEEIWSGKVEAFSRHTEPSVARWYGHGLVGAIHLAYAEHFPLILSPDMLWLPIVQGLAAIVARDPETHRSLLVSHEGKLTLEVRRDAFVLGSPENDWPGVYAEFSETIRDHVGVANHESLVASFSTTGSHERAANEIALMDVVQHYFTYELVSICGIPTVYLDGTAGDWEELRRRTAAIGEAYGCTWWTDHMLPWLDRIARAADGAEDRELCQTIYKEIDKSGGPFITGWITQFFPYIGDRRSVFWPEPLPPVENPALGRVGQKHADITTDMFAVGLSKVPFVWLYHGRRIAMAFHAGFLGTSQVPETQAIRPRIGWAVVRAT